MNAAPQAPAVAVTDTNVFIDISSCHDLIAAVDEIHGQIGDAAMDDPLVTYRLARARESALLAMYLNRIGATTYNPIWEPITILQALAPPDAPGGTSMQSDFTRIFAHYVKDYLLPDWNPTMPAQVTAERGNQADRVIVACALDLGLPVITNEGNTIEGLLDVGMRRQAREAGVRVFAPREFYAGHINEADEIESFLRRFREEAPRYLEAHIREFGPDQIWRVLQWVEGYFAMILLGRVEGRDAPVRVTLT